MSFGLRTYDEAGNIDVDVSTRLHRFHSKHTVTFQSGAWRRFPVTGLADDGTWVVLVFQTYIAVDIAPGEVLLRRDFSIPYPVTVTFYVYRC